MTWLHTVTGSGSVACNDSSLMCAMNAVLAMLMTVFNGAATATVVSGIGTLHERRHIVGVSGG